MRLFFVLAALFLSFETAALSAEVRYTGDSLRDPFSLTVVRRNPAVDEPALTETNLRGLTIQGILASVKDPRAIIDGKIHRVGSEVAPGAKIVRIEKNGITVLSGQKEILLVQTKRKPVYEPPKKP